MKPLQVGLLVLGAALVGGVAVKMTQPQPVPPAVLAPPPATPQPRPAPLALPPATRVPETPATAPPPVFVEPAPPPQNKLISKNKPNPFPTPVPTPPARLLPPAAYVAPTPAEPKPSRRHVTLQSGMTILVRISQSLSGCAKTGETFSGSLAEPLVVDHLEIAERGARINGRCSGTAPVELQLSRLVTSDGQLVGLSTDTQLSEAPVNGLIPFRLISPVTITEREIN